MSRSKATASPAGKPAASPASDQPRVIKKYPNRRLYDTDSSTYITLAQVRELVMRAQSLAEIRDGLDALLPGMSLDQYASAMAVALRTAEMAGRYEVLQEAGGLNG